MMNETEFSLGLSPCPNDTFIFHALLHGLAAEFAIPKPAPLLADVQRLNEMAIKKELPVTKVSLGVIPHIQGNYRILSAGAALGWGCGPLIVSRKGRIKQGNKKIAIPGKYTTANLLLDLNGDFEGERIEMLFSDIMPAVANGDADLGVIIHEGRFTFPEYGLEKALDLGEWWESEYHMPLPLGAIVVRNDFPAAGEIEKAIAASLEAAWRNPDLSWEFVRANAQEMEEEVIRSHIKTFVTEFSRDLGTSGKAAIRTLVAAGCEKRGIAFADSLFVDKTT